VIIFLFIRKRKIWWSSVNIEIRAISYTR